jgi:CheY-like chemotaxis protein
MDAEGGHLKIVLDDVELSSDFLGGYPQAEAGSFIRLTVTDSGCGIPEGDRERVFDPFFTTKKEGEGTGMGLSMVHGIVTHMGGVVTVESAEGRGTTFQIFLPIIGGEAKSPIPETGPLPTGNERILLVEDEEFQADIGKQMLTRLGYDVTIRTDSREAWALFADDHEAFDLVITDMTMPDMTGYELSRKLLEIRPGLPIILCTGYSAHLDAEKVRAIGAKGLLMKPIGAREMARMVRRALEA